MLYENNNRKMWEPAGQTGDHWDDRSEALGGTRRQVTQPVKKSEIAPYHLVMEGWPLLERRKSEEPSPPPSAPLPLLLITNHLLCQIITPQQILHSAEQGFSNLSIINIMDWITVCWGIGGTALCIIEYLAASHNSTHRCQCSTSQVAIIRNVSRNCQMHPGWQNHC